MSQQQEEAEGEGEEGYELRVRGGHAVAFAVHLCPAVSQRIQAWKMGSRSSYVWVALL